jgi:alpha-beta hydrolase superfamily lysophospholipase
LLLAGLMAGLLAACAPVHQPMGPRVVAPALGADGFTTADGVVLPLRSWLPAAQPRAVILGLHGFNDYAHVYRDAGPWWAERGIATYAYDQRGFGAAPRPGIWPGTKTLQADLIDAARAVRTRHPGVPLFLMGHSMGGAVVMTTLADQGLPDGVAGAVLVAPAVWSRDSMPVYQRAALAIATWTVPWMDLSPPRGLRRYASDNIAMLREMGRDPLVLKETRVDAVAGLTDLMDAAVGAVPRVRGPVLVLYGDNEDILPAAPVNRALAAFPTGPDGPRLAVYPQGWHMLLRDLAAETVWADIAAWITDPAAPLPSAADTRPRRIPVREGRPPLPSPP